MIDINEMESFLWEFFGESHDVRAKPKPASEVFTERDGVYLIQDLGPALADFLHERGVDVDWTDRSRYHGANQEKETQP
jgi:hypothetical protein